MRSSMSWEDLWPLLLDGTLDTLYMVGLAALFTVLIGLPTGVLLFISRANGLAPMPKLNALLGAVINYRQVAAVYRTADRPDPLYPPDRRHHAGQHRRHRAGNHRRLSVLCPSDGKRARRGGLREN